MPAIANYILHLLIAILMLVAFFKIYAGVTPFDEVLLIRQGNVAAMLSFAGAIAGFVVTIASAVIHTADYREFFAWGAGAMVAQVIVYMVVSRLLRNAREHIESGNVAYGGLMGTISLCVGIINGACIS